MTISPIGKYAIQNSTLENFKKEREIRLERQRQNYILQPECTKTTEQDVETVKELKNNGCDN